MDKISGDELKLLLEKARKNDDSAFLRLCKLYEGMIRKSVAAFDSRIDMPAEDIHQEALLAFSRAVTTYDIEKKEVTFGLFAKICVKNALISLERKSNSRKRRKAKLAEMPSDAKDIAEPKLFWGVRGEKTKLIEQNLTPIEGRILEMFVEGMSYAEIAEGLGISKKKVDNTLYRLRKKLKKTGII